MQISIAPKRPMKPDFHTLLASAAIRNIRNADQRFEMYSVCVILIDVGAVIIL